MANDRLTRRAALLTGAGAGAAVATRALAAPDPPKPPRKVSYALAAAGTPFVIGCDGGGVTSLRYRGDRFDTDYVRAGGALGRVIARHRSGTGEWRTLDSQNGTPRWVPDTLAIVAQDETCALATTLRLDGEALVWEIALENRGSAPLEIGDLMLPLPMHTRFLAGRPATEAVLKHSFVSGHGSHLFWMRSNSAGPYLTMLPEPGTHLEYWERPTLDGAETYAAFIHAAAAAAATRAQGCNWRQPVTSLTLAPGERRTYGFRFSWASDYAAVRDAIAAAGLIDVEIVPGMTLPTDLDAQLALRSASPVIRIEPEYPETTRIEPLPPRGGRQLYRLRFARLGENRLTLHQADGRTTHLEFFATEPLETMIGKRGAFIAAHQHRDPAKWYDGLFAEWNMESGALLGPDNYDRIKGWRIYEVTCDDPGLSKPAYLATKNAEHPVAGEVAALDQYIDRFVWGGLQRSTAEKHPYGIYGIPDWKTNRDSADPGPKGRDHIWRPYDYPHIVALYFGMFRVARDHSGVPTRLGADEYLRRAHGTALAMFTVPMRVTGWSAYQTGFYNECILPDLIAALETRGWAREAAELQGHWARKVRFFVQENADLFGSEYPFDSTGFESTQALARSALDHPQAMGVTRVQAERFAARQFAANLFCRGWLEPAYYLLGSDYRAQGGDDYTLSYMAQMGGWAVLDHALRDAAEPHAMLRLGYASQLSSWALLNSGTPESGYGYWYPGAAHDGAAAGGFEPAPVGKTWLEQPHHRGAWYYSCEIDLGFCGAVRAARTILADDPLFGRIGYGGNLEGRAIVPRDGVRRRFSVRVTGAAFDIELLDARFAAGKLVRWDDATRELVFECERFAKGAHLSLTLRGTPGRYDVAGKTVMLADALPVRMEIRLTGARVTVRAPA